MTSLAWGWFFWLPVTQPWKQADPGPGTWLEALPWDSEHRFPWERSRGRAGVTRAGALPAASLGPPPNADSSSRVIRMQSDASAAPCPAQDAQPGSKSSYYGLLAQKKPLSTRVGNIAQAGM